MRHPRFRAAFDFLLLRAAVDPDLAEQARRWERAQSCHENEFDALFRAAPAGPAMAAMPAIEAALPAKKRRRRRRRSGEAPVAE
jgi:poly(A) polymerase